MPRARSLSERSRMVGITLYLTPGQAAAMVELNKNTRVPMAVFCREAIDLVLAKYEPASVGPVDVVPESGRPQQGGGA